MARKRAASDCGASSNLFAPATLLQNTAGQVSGFLSQADEQPGAAAVGQHGAHFGSLSRHPADGAVNRYVYHLPSATLLPHDVVQNIPLTGSRDDLGLYDPIAPGGPDDRRDLEALAGVGVEIGDVGRNRVAPKGIPTAARWSGGSAAKRGPITCRRITSRSKVRSMTGAIMSYRCRNGAVLPAFIIAISPAWSCSAGAVTSDATAAPLTPRASAIEASASRRRVRRSGKVMDINIPCCQVRL